jgi:hypothetical protein
MDQENNSRRINNASQRPDFIEPLRITPRTPANSPLTLREKPSENKENKNPNQNGRLASDSTLNPSNFL